MLEGKVFVGGGGEGYRVPQGLALEYANRHGLIAGATGTGKTVTLQILAEGFSAAGVPVFLSDVKGDLSGLAAAGSPEFKLHEAFRSRAATIGFHDYRYEAFPVTFWDLFGEQGHPIRTTVAEMGPLLLSRLLDLTEAQEGVINIAFRVADDGTLVSYRFRASAGGQTYEGRARTSFAEPHRMMVVDVDTPELEGRITVTLEGGNPHTEVAVELTVRSKGMLACSSPWWPPPSPRGSRRRSRTSPAASQADSSALGFQLLLRLLELLELGGDAGGGVPSPLGDLSSVGEEGHLVVEDLEEPAVDPDEGPVPIRLDDHRPGGESGHGGLVIGEDADLAFDGPGDDEGRLPRPHRRLGRHHVHLEALRHQPAFSSSRPLAWASSRLPTM